MFFPIKNYAVALLLAAYSVLPAYGTVTFDLEADRLDTVLNSPMATTGLVLLVASTTDANFVGATSGNINVGDFLDRGDDQIVARFDLRTSNSAGALYEQPLLTLGGNWNANDKLAIFWFPTLTLASTAVPAGTSYGAFTAGTAQDGSDPWVTPGDGGSINLYFFTTDAQTLGPGTHTALEGNATSLTSAVAPEPSVWFVLILGMLVSGGALFRRRFCIAS